ncbi:MAG: hypothetical protein KC635_21565 [Myxococcales bacterium]|nr:hypothetical protein [Myxococcales bacterium]MCB9737145.1 hypothetical protein [Deltaproteobacteria bacterium]
MVTPTKRAPGLLLAVLALAALAPAPACDSEDFRGDELQCPSDNGPFTVATSRVRGTVALDAVPEKPIGPGESVIVRGTANHLDGLAIREVRVAGVAAELVAFNFSDWSVTLPYEAVVLVAPANAQGQVEVEVVAIDACNERYPFATFALPVDQTPQLRVDSLELTAAFPGDRGFVPADASAAATLTIVATGRAANAKVTLATDDPEAVFQGVDAENRVTLTADDADTARATAIFYAGSAGSHVITARVEDQLASVVVRAAGAPVLAPDRATLVAGSGLDAIVSTGGDLKSCQVTQTKGFSVTSADGTPITTAPTAFERVDDQYRLAIATSPVLDANETEELTILCLDAYGQIGAGRYTLTPPP